MMRRPFLALLRKETRDIAGLLACGLVGVLVLAMTMRAVTPTGSVADYARDCAPWAATIFAALGSVTVAAELFSGEVSSRRIDTTALLPVPGWLVFAAKIVVGLVAALVSAGGSWLSQYAAMATFGAAGEAATFPGFGEEMIPMVFVSLALVPCAALASSAVASGIGTALGAFGVLVGCAIAAWAGPWVHWSVGAATMTGAAVFLVAVGAAGTGALLAWTKGPVHSERRLRRAALGFGVPFLVLTTAAGSTVAALEIRLRVEPGDPRLCSDWVQASPDGRFVTAHMMSLDVEGASATWSVRVADGRVVPFESRSAHVVGWAGPTLARTNEGWSESVFGGRSATADRLVDIETGAFVATVGEGATDETVPDFWARTRVTDVGVVVEWPERGISRVIRGANYVVASPRAGRVAVPIARDRVRIVDLDTGRDREFACESSVGSTLFRRGGSVLTCVRTGGASALVDLETGVETPAPWFHSGQIVSQNERYIVVRNAKSGTLVRDAFDGHVVYTPSDAERWFSLVPGSDHFGLRYGAPSVLVDLRTGRGVDLAFGANEGGRTEISPWMICGLAVESPGADPRFVVVRPGAQLDVIDGAGRTIRTLLGASETVRR